ncbi:MAG: nuclear transport factor 2 family protein, partial [Caulobacteraceae bacterium]
RERSRQKEERMADTAAPDVAKELAELKDRLARLEDAQAIKHLQFAYGYYLDKCLYEEVVDLFAEDGEVVFGGGVFRGRAGLTRLYIEMFRKNFTGGHNGPVWGFLLDHQQMQEIITVAPDRRTAKGRFRCFMQAGTHTSKRVIEGPGPLQQWWEGGLYENDFVREDGVWKIRTLNYNVVFQGTFEEGWAKWGSMFGLRGPLYPENPMGPDALIEGWTTWPNTPTVPFHYPHPVTGKPYAPAEPDHSRRPQ